MKKMFALLLAAMLICLTLPGLAEEQKELHIFSWMGYVDDEVIGAFEDEYGISVVWSPMDSIDSMLLKVTEGGGSEYDLILTSDYSIDILRRQGLLQPLDKTALSNYKNLDPMFLGQKYDPQDEYVIPYMAGCPLIVYNAAEVDRDIQGYADLWDEAFTDSVAVLENARVLCGMVLKTMGKSMNETDPEVLAQMKETLMPLYRNIRTFGDTESYLALLSGEANVGFVFTPFAYLLQMESEDFKVVYPKEGLGYGIDGFVIPAGAKNTENAHLFLDFLMRPEIAAHNAEYQGYLCVNAAAKEYLSDYFLSCEAMNVPAEMLAEAEFIEDIGAVEVQYQEIYAEFKNQ